MKRFLQKISLGSLVGAVALSTLLATKAVAVDSCSVGQGEPPFLSYGVQSNLLLLIDNSGSMLDMAYVEEADECVDNSYLSTNTYTGLFDSSKWYRWIDGVTPWENGETYSVGDYVYTEGIFYRATAATGNPSIGVEIKFDSEVVWNIVYQIDVWENGTEYAPDSFVQYEGQLWYTPVGGKANDSDTTDGIDIYNDGISWFAVDSTWLSAQTYAAGDVVSDNGMLYRATSASTGVRPSEDTSGADWVRLDEGFFEEVAYTDVTDAATAFSLAAGTPYLSVDNELAIKIVSALDDTATLRESTVSFFAAKGNFLNWASASKFDIQKKILTGGKYDINEDHLVSQSRGCASHNFFKEIGVKATLTGDQVGVLTLAVNGPSETEWIDTTDSTTRISVLGVSSTGYIDSTRAKECEIAIAEFAKDDPNQGTVRTSTKICLAYDGTNNIMAESNSAYNHSIHECWFIKTKPLTSPSELGVSEIEQSCEHIYNLDMPPPAITPENSGYICYGVYNETLQDPDRLGYVGRCWVPSEIPAGCLPVPCVVGTPYNTGNPRCLPDDYMYECSGNFNDQQDACNKDWYVQLQDDPAVAGTCPVTSAATSGGTADWITVENPNDKTECIQQAVWDYCQGVTLPEVIDPTDQLFDTTETWGMPGALVDSGVAAMFGTDRPLLVMKGYIRQTTVPGGVLHDVAEDLRFGAMAFNNTGSAYECTEVVENDTIVEYCPPENRDGAQVITQIKGGTETDANGNFHVENVAAAINDIRATAWTPLAEAIYNAIGYYGQNVGDDPTTPTIVEPGFRLDEDDFTVEVDDAVNWPDPVEHWCQQNHILVITEGASTTDVNTAVEDFVLDYMPNTLGIDDNAVDAATDVECGYVPATTDSITGVTTPASHQLFGSTYLDDLTYFAAHGDVSDIYADAFDADPYSVAEGTPPNPKQNITTHFITNGMPRDDGSTSECNPQTLMENAAANAGTELLTSEDPDQLETNLRATISAIAKRVSAGSAASVISSARGGEGAIYQAIFWPELTRVDAAAEEWTVDWAGDLHGLFVNSKGYMYEDTYGDRTMIPTEDVDNDGVLGTVDEDVDGDGRLDVKEDLDGDGTLGPGEDLDGDGNLDVDEDLDGDGCLDVDEDLDNDGVLDDLDGDGFSDHDETDNRVIIYYDEAESRSKACLNTSIIDSGTCTSTSSVDLSEVNFLWEANEWLAKISNPSLATIYNANDIYLNREAVDYISNVSRRYIFTWNDIDNDGIVDYGDNEVLPFVERDSGGTLIDWESLVDDAGSWAEANDRGGVVSDFSAANSTEISEIISWVRGADSANQRSRKIPVSNTSSTMMTWRLGDIIHSTPMTVTSPAEGYHFLYGDASYAKFFARYKNRRHVIYFGANDGMLHAVNGGFYSRDEKKFCLVPLEDDGSCNDSLLSNAPALGAELWAYIPYNLLPHLKCLTDTGYDGPDHKYYVDLRPRIYDAKIFQPEPECASLGYDDPACIHPEGWGTILVGGMRFGGAPLAAPDDFIDATSDNRQFISSYFILDITSPEEPPVLLGELTQTLDDVTLDPEYADLGYSTVNSTMVIMKDDTTTPVTNDWYLILGSGPHGPDAIQGVSDQTPKISVLNLTDLVDKTTNINKPIKSLRIPSAAPASGSPDGTFSLATNSGNGFVSDLITVDFDINHNFRNYKSDAVYFGTVEGAFGASGWNGGGIMYRMVTRGMIGGTYEFGKNVTEIVTEPDDWPIMPLLDLTSQINDEFGDPLMSPKPITAAASAAYDGQNFWIFFGTGRFFDTKDKTDESQQTYFGIKEPMQWLDVTNCATNKVRKFTWDEVELTYTSNIPGQKGLLQVDDILVTEATTPALATLSCRNTGTCLPTNINTLEDLIGYTSGEGACDNQLTFEGKVDGWYRDFYPYANRERNLGQATVLGGLLTFTTYQPFDSPCQAEGLAYLYAVLYVTGTPWHENIFGLDNLFVLDKGEIGRGLALTPNLHVGEPEGGGKEGAKVFVQTSTGEIKEIKQESTPFNIRPGAYKWKEFPGCP